MWLIAKVLLKFVVIFAMIYGMLRLFRFVSERYRLLDMPDYLQTGRSQSTLMGALVLYLTAALTTVMLLDPDYELYLYLAASATVIILAVIDQHYNMLLNKRLFVEIIVAVFMVFGAGVQLETLGDVFFLGDVYLSSLFSIPLTLLMAGVFVNAMYRIDGIEGMVSGLSIEAMLTLLILTGVHASILWLIIALVAMVTVFLVEELKLQGKVSRIVMGEAGSMFLGFSIVWGVISYSQVTYSGESLFDPVTGLYVLGLPLIDMAANSIRLYRRGLNPFANAFAIHRPSLTRRSNFSVLSAHTHMQHILIHAGFTKRKALFTVLMLGGLINMTGILLHVTNVPEGGQMMLWLGLVLLYYRAQKSAFRISHWLHRIRRPVSHV